MESGQEISVEKRALRKDHLVTDPSRLSQSISLSFALAVFHLTPLSPAPVSWASIFHFIVPFLLLQALSTSLSSLLQHLDTGHARPATNFPSVSD